MKSRLSDKDYVETACRAEQYLIKCRDGDSAIFIRYSSTAAGAGAVTKGGSKKREDGRDRGWVQEEKPGRKEEDGNQ